MDSEHTLIATIAVGLTYAFFGGVAAHRMGLPPLVGYLLAGIALGPFTPGFVADVKLAPELAELGVILLMYGVGMHFSVSDLWEVRGMAVPGALAQMGVATAVGMGVARFWGWTWGEGFIFGMALSVASTVVLLRALEDQGQLTSKDGRVAIGWLIVEDVVMVLALVLIPVFAGLLRAEQNHVSSWPEIAKAVGITLSKIAAFIALMLLVGVRFLPWILRRGEQAAMRELFTLASIAVPLGIAFAAAEIFGVSFALGAFFAGVAVNESELIHKAAHEVQPVQSVFAALFFVAVGMLFDPLVLVAQPHKVLTVAAIIIIGKSLAAVAIVLCLGGRLKSALTIASSLAQIGEFSFILAALGENLGLLEKEGRDLIVAGAMISILVNPFAVRWAMRPSAQ